MLNNIEKMGLFMLLIAAIATICSVAEGIISSTGLIHIIKKLESIDALQHCPLVNELPLIRPVEWLKQSNDGRSPCDTPYPDIKLQKFPEDFVFVSSKKGIW